MPVTIQNMPMGPLGWKTTSYAAWNPFNTIPILKETDDWAGFYIAPSKEMAEGYGADYLDSYGNGSAFIHEVHLIRSIRCVVCTDALMGSRSVSRSEKAAHIRANLPPEIVSILPSGALIRSLGRLGYALKCYHDEERNVEIIFPNNLSALLILAGTRELEYRGFFRK
jgi:hypothetical protein